MNCSKHRHDGGAYRRYKTMVVASTLREEPSQTRRSRKVKNIVAEETLCALWEFQSVWL